MKKGQADVGLARSRDVANQTPTPSKRAVER